ncbi:MAG: capsule assembly Wzi family protein [Bacteroidales bacterium]
MKYFKIAALLSICATSLSAQHRPDITLETSATAGGGDSSPFWLVSNRHGLASISENSAYLRAGLTKSLDNSKRIDYSYGVDLVGAYNHNSNFIVQQLFMEAKYRSLFISVGSKERSGMLNNARLSTGGVAWSGNSRPIPQVRAGFIDWVRPFKSVDWFSLKGEVSYGWFTDKNYQEEMVNRQYGFMSTGAAYHHKGIYFKFGKDNSRWAVEAGYELDSEFGGKRTQFKNGEISNVDGGSIGFKDYLKAFVPLQGGSTYYEGNYVGGWQVKLIHNINSIHKLSFTMENIFDDASSMGMLNRGDGLWTLEYSCSEPRIISGALFEYFQSTNQSGPLHWYPSDMPEDTDVNHHAPGADNYYNNYWYVGWSHWGQAMGNPLITSPAFNKDGLLQFKNNRVKAWHAGVNGFITPELEHRVLMTYQRGWGTPFIPFTDVKESFSGLLELTYTPRKFKRMSFVGSLAFDKGTLLGDNFGASVSVKKRF